MTLMVWPSQDKAVSENRMASGISIRMMTVERQLPRKQQDHHADQRRGQRGLADDAEHRSLDEDRLIADRMHVDAFGKSQPDPGQQGFDPIDDAEGRGRARLEDRHQHRPRSVDADQVGLRRRAIVHERDVVNVNDRAVDLFQREIVDPVEQDGTGVQRDVPVELADLFVPGRDDEVLRRDGVDDIVGRNIGRLHGLLIEIDLNLQDFAAIRGRHRGARDGGQLRTNEVLTAIEQVHLRQLFARKREL